MKKVAMVLLATCFAFTMGTTTSKASEAVVNPSSVTVPANVSEADKAKAAILIERLNEIKLMDKSGLKSPQRKALRKEVTSIKKELAGLSGGVYLSVGAIIVIILLLILIL